MAIEQFGQSLLAGQRQRQRRVAKQQRRMQRETALGTIVGGIGNAFLKQKAEDFLNDEGFRAELVQLGRASKEYEKALPLQEEMIKQNKNPLQYYQDSLMTQADARVKEILQNDELATLPEVQEVVRKRIYEEAKAQAEAFENVMKYGAQLATPEEAVAARQRLVKENLPTNVGQALAGWAVNLFKPEDKKKIEYDVLLESANNKYKDNLTAFELANAAFNSGRGLSESFKIADEITAMEKDIMSDERAGEFRTLTDSSVSYTSTGTPGIFRKATKNTYFDRRLNASVSLGTEVGDPIDLRTTEGKEKAFQDAMPPFSSSVYMSPLTNDARIKLVNTKGFIFKPKNPDEYQQSYEIYKEVASQPENIRPDFNQNELDINRIFLEGVVRTVISNNYVFKDEDASPQEIANFLEEMNAQLNQFINAR